MIQTLLELLQQCFAVLIWWTVVQPWEEGIRVRLGRKRKKLLPGIHFMIPYADVIFKQTIRLRYTNFGPLSVTTLDGQTLTLSGSLGYSIRDLDLLYDRLHDAEDGIHSITAGAVTEFVAANKLSDCSPESITEGARKTLNLARFGISVKQLTLTSYAKVRAIRLITDSDAADKWGDNLDTESRHS